MATKTQKQNTESEKVYFDIKMAHSEDTFRALSHMQYDLFCTRNLILRTIIGLAAIGFGVYKLGNWWAYLLIAYGAFQLTGKYSQANHTVRKLVNSIEESKMPFPSSEYLFEEHKMRVISTADNEELSPVYYKDILKLGQDKDYYYIFPNSSGGYMIPRVQLLGHENEFIAFLKSKTGQTIFSKFTPPVVATIEQFRKKKNEPYHL